MKKRIHHRPMRACGMRVLCAATVTAAMAGAATLQAETAFDTTVIAVSGDAAPDGDGTFDHFELPTLNDAGQVAFGADLTETDDPLADAGIFLGHAGTLTQVVRTGAESPNDNGTFGGLGVPALNNAGQIAFAALPHVPDDFSTHGGIYRTGGSTLAEIARYGGAAPDGNGTFDLYFSNPVLNDDGQVAFMANLADTTPASERGIYTNRRQRTHPHRPQGRHPP